ncbi:hypothetical protein [Clostridium perfringens]|uniref:Uncharacterized protein n=1 Tax=Clostridium perfringens (strain 13 / Type A) TaxID=195102 RepID=Q8XLE0_CLOPE|nr:hypothetical protein [Clostridium perfringens]BAB80808.1 hypothetical protein [Clostridium perfringens str. 13]
MTKEQLTEELEGILEKRWWADLEWVKTEDFRLSLLKEVITLTDYYKDTMLTEDDVLKLINYSFDIFNIALENSKEYIDDKKVLKVAANPCYWDGEKVFFHGEEYGFTSIKNIELFKSLELGEKISLLEAMTGLDQEEKPEYLCLFEYKEDEYLLERDWSGDLEYYTLDEAIDEWMGNDEENMIEESKYVDEDSYYIQLLLELQGYQVVILERSRFLDHSHLDEIYKYLKEGYKLIRAVDLAYVEKAEKLDKQDGWYDNERSMQTFVNNCLYTTLVK